MTDAPEGRFLVLQTEELDAPAAAWLASRVDLRALPVTDPSFPDLLARAHGLVIRTYTRIDEPLLAAAPRLRVIGRAGVGLDRVDLAACGARNVRVVHTPDANSGAVAELVFSLLLAHVRPVRPITSPLPLEQWKAARHAAHATRSVEGLTLGVLGLGRIGSRVARIGSALGMRVIFHDLREIPAPEHAGASPVDSETLRRESDVLSIHIDPRPANHRLIDETWCSLLRRDVVLVNTSRGVNVDAAGLARFLKTAPAAHALLDVHDPEPFDASYPLLDLPNVTLTPHMAAATSVAHSRMSEVVHDVWRVLSGETPRWEA